MNEPILAAIMAQAQAFASSWSLVGSPLEADDQLEQAEAEKAELRGMIFALVMQRDEARARVEEMGQQSNLDGEMVQCYLYALLNEAKRRGEMFPQTRDEQDTDADAVHRVCRMVEWYAERGEPTLKNIEKLRTARARAKPWER